MDQHRLFVQEIDAVIAHHAAWRKNLLMEINLGHKGLSTDAVSDATCCQFGVWLDSEKIAPDARRTEPYNLARWLHAEVHALAGELVTLARDGRKFEASQLADRQFMAVSNILIHVLEEWRNELAGYGPSRLFGS